MILFIALITTSFAQRGFPDFPPVNQQCEDDAGPRWLDDLENFGQGKFYWSDSHARAVLNQDGTCPTPVEEACQSRMNPLQAFVEGPISCPDAWACRIYPDPNHGSGYNFLGDKNFGNCDQPNTDSWDATNTDQDGHCHGGLDPSSYYWWVRDHWNRPYSGRVKCCCVDSKEIGNTGRRTMDLDGIANRCDYRAKVTVGADNCRDANEDHAGGRMNSGFLYGYDGPGGFGESEGCPRTADGKVAYTREPADEMCWEILNFGLPDENDRDPTIYESSTGPCVGAGSATGGSCNGVEAFPGQFSGPEAPQYVRPAGSGPYNPIATQPSNTNPPEATNPPDVIEATDAPGSTNFGNEAILAIGDSSIDPEFELGTLSQNCASKTVINLGASGSTAEQWLNGDINLAEARDEDVTFTHAYVSLGGNDIMGDGCRIADSVFDNLVAINNQVRSIYGNAIQIVMTGYGMGPDPSTDGCGDDVLEEFQAMVGRVAQVTGATFVDVRNLFKRNPSDSVGQSRYFVDAIHYNRAGYDLMWSQPAIQSAFNCASNGNNSGGSSDATATSDPEDDEESTSNSGSGPSVDASFYTSETESCPTGSYITSEETCIAAAQGLGIAEELARSINNHRRTRGCYVRNGKVYFNENPSLTNSNRSTRRSICCSSDSCDSAADEDYEEYEEEYEEEEQAVFVSENGACPSGSKHIETLEDCEEAAEFMGFTRVRAFRKSTRLRGCYVFRNRAWFNRDDSLTQPNQTARKSVCVN